MPMVDVNAPGRVAELLNYIARVEANVEELRAAHRMAADNLNKAECQLANARIELTKQIAPVLDVSTARERMKLDDIGRG